MLPFFVFCFFLTSVHMGVGGGKASTFGNETRKWNKPTQLVRNKLRKGVGEPAWIRYKADNTFINETQFKNKACYVLNPEVSNKTTQIAIDPGGRGVALGRAAPQNSQTQKETKFRFRVGGMGSQPFFPEDWKKNIHRRSLVCLKYFYTDTTWHGHAKNQVHKLFLHWHHKGSMAEGHGPLFWPSHWNIWVSCWHVLVWPWSPKYLENKF